jgi:hypothetical protein
MTDDPFGKEAHDEHAPNHSGEEGHFCWEWDGLWICKDCPEFEFCHCLVNEVTP